MLPCSMVHNLIQPMLSGAVVQLPFRRVVGGLVAAPSATDARVIGLTSMPRGLGTSARGQGHCR